MYAFTELHNDYPAFVNLSEQPDGSLKLSVRTRGNGGKEYASINLAPAQAEELADAVYKHVRASQGQTEDEYLIDRLSRLLAGVCPGTEPMSLADGIREAISTAQSVRDASNV